MPERRVPPARGGCQSTARYSRSKRISRAVQAETLKPERRGRARIARSVSARSTRGPTRSSPRALPPPCSRARVPSRRAAGRTLASAARRSRLPPDGPDLGFRREPVVHFLAWREAAALGAVVRRLGDPDLQLLRRRLLLCDLDALEPSLCGAWFHCGLLFFESVAQCCSARGAPACSTRRI